MEDFKAFNTIEEFRWFFLNQEEILSDPVSKELSKIFKKIWKESNEDNIDLHEFIVSFFVHKILFDSFFI